MEMKKIANHVALKTLGYLIGGLTHVCIYTTAHGYKKQDIFRGMYKDFAFDGMHLYGKREVTELRADENVLFIGISE